MEACLAEESGSVDLNLRIADMAGAGPERRASQPYHQPGRARSLGQALKSIKEHDVFQMNGRKQN